jgi:thiosulfate reductase cytochrome b subunit
MRPAPTLVNAASAPSGTSITISWLRGSTLTATYVVSVKRESNNRRDFDLTFTNVANITGACVWRRAACVHARAMLTLVFWTVHACMHARRGRGWITQPPTRRRRTRRRA